MTWNAAPSRTRPSDFRPNWPSADWFHRAVSSSSGGSETRSSPPIARNRTAHSAVTAGGPKDRAVTNSNCPSRSGSRDSSSARPLMTWPPGGAPSHPSTSSMNIVLFIIESRNVAGLPQCSRSTRPGSPPPLPRSRNCVGAVDDNPAHTRENPEACSIWVSIEVGPKKPRALDSSRARYNHWLVTESIMPEKPPRSGEALRPRTG